MAHTTSIYYRARLGFEPDYESPHRQYSGGGGGKTSSGKVATMEGSSVQRHVSSSMQSSSSHAVRASSSSTSMTRQVTSSSASYQQKSSSTANGSAAYYSVDSTNGHGGYHANGDSGIVTTVSRMDTHRSGGHYEDNLQQFKGSSKKCSEVKVKSADA